MAYMIAGGGGVKVILLSMNNIIRRRDSRSTEVTGDLTHQMDVSISYGSIA